MKPLEQLKAEIVETFKKLQPRETPLPLARLIVEARRDHFITPRGGPDLQGRSYAWRNWYGDILREAFPDNDERLKMGSRLRYGIGVALREMIPENELQEAGLMKISPRERTAMNNKERSIAYKTVTESVENMEDVEGLYSIVVTAASKIEDPELLESLFKLFENFRQDVERRIGVMEKFEVWHPLKGNVEQDN